MKQIYLICIIVLVVIVIILFCRYLKYKEIKESIQVDITPQIPRECEPGKLPKIIWSFWHSNQLPKVVYKCIESWKKTNPDFDVHIVTKDSLEFYLPNNKIFTYPHCGEGNIQKASDFIRLELIYKYGGFWIDASVILNGSLQYFLNIQEDVGYDFLGYYLEKYTKNPNYPVIENWFFAAVKESQILKLWLDCFTPINRFPKVNQYIDWVKKQGVDTQGINYFYLNYLSMHVACQLMLQKKLSEMQIHKLMYLEKAEDGPLKYLSKTNWNSWSALHNVCKNKDLQTLVLKMRWIERKLVLADPRLLCIFD